MDTFPAWRRAGSVPGLRLPDVPEVLAAEGGGVGSDLLRPLSLRFAATDWSALHAIACVSLMPGTFAKISRRSVGVACCSFLAAVIAFPRFHSWSRILFCFWFALLRASVCMCVWGGRGGSRRGQKVAVMLKHCMASLPVCYRHVDLTCAPPPTDSQGPFDYTC